jgi:hypothetical protein
MDADPARKRRAALKWLELDVSAAVVSEEDVVTNYRRLAKLYHPDKNGGSAEAVARWAGGRAAGNPTMAQCTPRHRTTLAFPPAPPVQVSVPLLRQGLLAGR